MASRAFFAALLLTACSGSLIDHNGLSAEAACPQTTAQCGPLCSACPTIPNETAGCLQNSCVYTLDNNSDGGGGGSCTAPSLAVPGGQCATPISVAAGGDTTCAIIGSTVQCWGLLPGQGGQKSATPVAISGLAAPSQIAVGGGHACAIQNRKVLCWGANESGQAGQPASASVATPTEVAGVDGATSLAAGGKHTCAVTANGIFCWGNDDSGQLGDTGGSRNTPQLVAGTAGATTVSAGTAHTCLGNGTGVSCWGAGAQGQIGNGSNASVAKPTAATLKSGGGTGTVQILASGQQHNCVVFNNSIQCWGAGAQGQLGDGAIGNQALPQKLDLVNPSLSLAGGGAHTCATVTGGTATGGEDGSTAPGLYCWGANDSGQLGTGSLSPAIQPQPLAPITLSGTASTVVAGTSHTCALLSQGGLLCWGANGNGQLGVGSNQAIFTSPTQIVSSAP